MVSAGRDNGALVITSGFYPTTADMTNSRCSELYTLVTAPNRALLSRLLSIVVKAAIKSGYSTEEGRKGGREEEREERKPQECR